MTVIREVHIKTKSRNLTELTKVAKIKRQTTASVDVDVEKSEPSPTAGGKVNCTVAMENRLVVLRSIKHRVST